MVLSLDTAVVNQNASISDDAGHGASAVAIDLNELLAATGGDHKLGRLHFLLNAENHALVRLDTDGGRTELSTQNIPLGLRFLTKKVFLFHFSHNLP